MGKYSFGESVEFSSVGRVCRFEVEISQGLVESSEGFGEETEIGMVGSSPAFTSSSPSSEVLMNVAVSAAVSELLYLHQLPIVIGRMQSERD